MAKAMSKVAEAYKRSGVAREALREIGARAMEATEEKCGIVWERFIVQTNDPTAVTPKFVSVVLFSTPHWWDVFVPLTDNQEIATTVAAIKALHGSQRAA